MAVDAKLDGSALVETVKLCESTFDCDVSAGGI